MSRNVVAKTHIERELPCGCVEVWWIFGRELIHRCPKHIWQRSRQAHPGWKRREGVDV